MICKHIVLVGGKRLSRFMYFLYDLLGWYYLSFSTPDNRTAGLEEADQQSLPGEQGINLDNTGPKLPEFSNRPPGNKILAKITSFALHIHFTRLLSLQESNNALSAN